MIDIRHLDGRRTGSGLCLRVTQPRRSQEPTLQGVMPIVSLELEEVPYKCILYLRNRVSCGACFAVRSWLADLFLVRPAELLDCAHEIGRGRVVQAKR